MRPQAVGWAWARLAARLSSIPPASTAVGHDSRLVTMPCCLSRWRSRAAITQVRSMQTATAQDIGPDWPCSAAVSRMWVNDPAPAMAASTVTGSASATASRRRPALTSRPAVRAVPDGPAGRPRPRPGLARLPLCPSGAAPVNAEFLTPGCLLNARPALTLPAAAVPPATRGRAPGGPGRNSLHLQKSGF